MAQGTPVRPRRRLANDDGAVIIEAALVLPLVMVFMAGIVDFGVAFRDRTIVQSALRNGARVGASSVNNPSADQLALSTMYAGLVPATRITITKAIIYEANGISNGEPSSTCRGIVPQATGAGNASGNCNVYGLPQILAAAGVSGTFSSSATCASPAWNRFWCASLSTPPNERTADLAANQVDSFGLYLEVAYEPFTGVFQSGDMTITDWVVMRMEPAPG